MECEDKDKVQDIFTHIKTNAPVLVSIHANIYTCTL